MNSDNAFAPVHSRESFLETTGAGQALSRLDDGLGARQPFLLVTGDPGTGKTWLAREAVARWGTRVTAAYLAYPALSGVELLEEIVRRFGGDPPAGASRPKLVACLEEALARGTADQVAMLVVDDAHDLSPQLLEELRLLANAAQQNRRPMEVMLVGLPALATRLDAPPFAALRQRVAVRVSLEPLSTADTGRYLHHRVNAVGGDGPGLFSRKTCREIASRTGGVPRRIDVLAAESMRVARALGDPTVVSEHVEIAAAALSGFDPVGAAEDVAEAGPLETSARPPAPAPAPPPEAVPSTPAKPAATSAAARATPAKERPAPVAAPEEVAAPAPTVPASHDSSEWVKRFVGDRGPVQIGARAFAETPSAREPMEPLEPASEEVPGPPEEVPPAPRGVAGRVLSMPRSRRRGWPRVPVTAALAGVAVVTAIVLVLHAGSRARGPARQEVATASLRDAAPQAPTNTKRPEPRGDRSSPASTSARETPAASPKGPHTLDVGGYADMDRALAERDRLAELTGIEGWVVPADLNGGRTHRVVLGVYRSHARAMAAANMLVRSRTLKRVNVVPLPPKDERY